MATVSFYRQTTGSTATGAITFDTTNKYIYLGDGSTAHKFDCTAGTWVALNGSTGVLWNTFKANATYRTARRIMVNFKSVPIKLLCPNLLYNCADTTNITHWVFERAVGFSGFSSSSETYPNYLCTSSMLVQSEYTLSSNNYSIFGYLASLYTDTSSEGRTMNFYYHYIQHTTSNVSRISTNTDWDTRESTSDSIAPYIKVMAVQY